MDYLPSALRPYGRDRVRHVEDGMSGSTLQFPPAPQPMPNPQQAATPVDPENKLALFRHLIGIQSANNAFNFEGRAAPNMGIYNRVCHREAAAKRGYKLASLGINSCLGLQVIVAAALTAMGAANSNHVGITAFGAINTVIAGLLTYLKGSGLPNRIRYYESEWKAIREFIEQRERDFSRPGCPLDVAHVVAAIEAMYEEVKADVQSNTPENYVPARAQGASAATTLHIPKLKDMIGGEAQRGRNKLEELELKYGHKVTDFLSTIAHKEEDRLKNLESELENSKTKALTTFSDEKDKITQSARDFERDMESKGAQAAEKEIEHARSSILTRGMNFAKDLELAKSGIMQRGESFARGIDAAKTSALQRGDAINKEVEASKAAVMQKSEAVVRDIDATKAAALQNTSHLADSLVASQDAAKRQVDGLADGLEASKEAARMRGREYDAEVRARVERGRDAVTQGIAAGQNTLQSTAENVRQQGEAKAAQLAVAERALEMEAARSREAAERVGSEVQAVGRDVQRVGESMQRVGRVVEEEGQGQQRRE